jgi:hypothetical protein
MIIAVPSQVRSPFAREGDVVCSGIEAMSADGR